MSEACLKRGFDEADMQALANSAHANKRTRLNRAGLGCGDGSGGGGGGGKSSQPQEGRRFRAAEDDLLMPPFEVVKHAETWGMSEDKYQRLQVTKSADFKKIKTSRDPRVVLNIPGILDEPGSCSPPPLVIMTAAENELKENMGSTTKLSSEVCGTKKNRFAAAGVLLWRENPETGSPEVLMAIEDRWEIQSQPLNHTAYPLTHAAKLACSIALPHAFRLAGGTGGKAPVRPPSRTWDLAGGSTSSEAAATRTPRRPARSP